MNMTESFLDFHSFQKNWNSNQTAIYDYDSQTSYSYQEMDRRSDRLADWLVHDMGLKKGDCIGFCARNCISYFDAFFATYKTGIIITTYNHMYKANELIDLIQNENPKILFLDVHLQDRIKSWSRNTKIQKFVIVNGKATVEGALNYDEILEGSQRNLLRNPDIQLEDIQMYIHTGGTTGMPKAAMLSYRAILANVMSEGFSFGLNNQDISYLFLPLFHTGGWNVIGIPILFYGGKLIIKRDLEPEKILEIIEKERVTIGVAVPTVYRMLADHPSFQKTDFSSVRWFLVGAAPAEESVMKEYHDRNICLTNAYGMTEVGPNNIAPPVQRMTMDQIREKWNSVGIPMCFNDVKIVDENDAEVAADEYGELCFKGAMQFSGYLNHQEETRQVLKDGWIYTGDIAKKDKDGFIYIIGRRKNMVIVGGENVYPIEIEECIARFPGVKEVCVFGVPNYKWGERLKAIISLEYEMIDLEMLQEYIKKNLSGVKRPDKIVVVDQIPKNSVGKIDYRIVHEQYDEI